VSNLILNIDIYMEDTASGKMEFAPSVDIRDNIDETGGGGGSIICCAISCYTSPDRSPAIALSQVPVARDGHQRMSAQLAGTQTASGKK
jgi:hypothetical protein